MILHNPEQIPLFEDEFMLLNDAAAALKADRRAKVIWSEIFNAAHR
jgi:hypothetical protein